MSRTVTIEVAAPRNLVEGETFTVEVEIPAPVRKPRGQLAGIALVDMTDEQLKRELINAKSVLYKAKQRGACGETVDANQRRVDAALAEKAKRAAENAPEVEDEIEVDQDQYDEE